MKLRHQLLWLLFIIAVLNLMELYMGITFAKGFCFGVAAPALMAFWEAGRAKQ